MFRFIRATNIHHLGYFSGRLRFYFSTKTVYHSGLSRAKLPVGCINEVQRRNVRGLHAGLESSPRTSGLPRRIISTLKRENLRSCDFIDISEKKTPNFAAPSTEEKGQTKGLLGARHLHSARLRYPPGKFPQNIRGFLYYYTPPGKPPLSGELRFRITTTSNPTSFEAGHDLKRQNGFYWRLQLPVMPKALRNLVLREQPFTPPMIAVYNKLVKQALTSSSTFLHYLEQPFLLDFAHSIKNITCVYNGDVRSVVLSNPTLTHSQSGLVIPYKGSAVARFELSTLPEHSGANMIVVRILKILEPVECVLPDYNGYYEKPEKGSLIMTCGPDGVRRAFTIDLGWNNTATVGLKIFLPGEHDIRPRLSDRVIPTLDSSRIQASDVLSLAANQNRLNLSFGNDMFKIIRLPSSPSGNPSRQNIGPYGFLYYFTLKHPDAMGEIRLRLTPSPDPSTFDEGHDLKRSDGRVWTIPLLRLVSDKQLDPLCQKLVEDELVTPSQIMRCKTLTSSCGIWWLTNSPILYTLSQPFQLDFSRLKTLLHLVGHDTIGKYSVLHQDKEPGRFTGRAWVRFEKSQQMEDIGKRVVMLRLLELAELVQLGIADEAHPVHTPPYGSLVMVTTQTGSRHPFRAHVDKSQLRLLWPDSLPNETGELNLPQR